MSPSHSLTGHATVPLQCKGLEGAVAIDTLLAPLIQELWQADIKTLQSCQEHRPGEAWIVFANTADLETFLTICQRPYKPSLESWWQPGRRGVLRARVHLQVFFPTADIAVLAETFRAYNAAAQ